MTQLQDQLRGAGTYYRARYESGPYETEHFEIAVPTQCTPCQLPVETAAPDVLRSPFVPVARFQSPATRLVTVEVAMTRLPREINVGDFGELDAVARGEEVVQRRDVDGWTGCHSEFFFHSGPSASRSVERVRFVKDGSRVFRVMCGTSLQGYEDRAKTCAATTMSFRILAPTKEISAEPLDVHSFGDSRRWCFSAPRFWQALDGNRVGVVSLRPAKEFPGSAMWIDVESVRSSKVAAAVVRNSVNGLRERGLRLGGAPLCPLQPPSGFDEAAFCSPMAEYHGKEHQVTVVALRSGRDLICFSSVAPSRLVGSWAWALCKRATEITLLTVRRAT